MIDRRLSTTRKDVRGGAKEEIVWRRVDKITKSWQNLFIKAGVCTPDMNKEGQFKVTFTRHDARRGFNVEMEKRGINLKDRSAILGHEPRVNRDNYNGETYIDLESVAEKMNSPGEKSIASLKPEAEICS